MTIQTRISSFTAAFNRAMEALCVKINSSNFAAAQRRRALSGLDTRQLADIGLIYTDGDYRPHPGTKPWQPEAAPAHAQRERSALDLHHLAAIDHDGRAGHVGARL